MIAKILSSTKTFAAVRYNTDKLDKQSGELMRIRNFGLLDNDFALRPEEVRNYLKAVSAANKNIKKPQFHATISCSGREYSKEQLSDIAEKWMAKMGYGKNPYIVVFHNDTRNNHVHIVSTRVGMDGKKVSDSFEHLRAIRHIEAILKVDSGKDIADDIKRVSDFRFSSIAQLILLFEMASYKAEQHGHTVSVYKGGRCAKTFDTKELDRLMQSHPIDKQRVNQLKVIIGKYRKSHDNALVPEFRKLKGQRKGEISGYRSELTDFLKMKFGLQFIFHFSEGKPPYGYTVIDNKGKAVYKGSELVKLKELVGSVGLAPIERDTGVAASVVGRYNIENSEHLRLLSKFYGVPSFKIQPNNRQLSNDEREYYSDLLRFYLDNNPNHELKRINIIPVMHSGKLYLVDTASNNILEAEEVLTGHHYASLVEEEGIQRIHRNEYSDWMPAVGWEISSDVDDEKTYGRERKRESGKSNKR